MGEPKSEGFSWNGNLLSVSPHQQLRLSVSCTPDKNSFKLWGRLVLQGAVPVVLCLTYQTPHAFFLSSVLTSTCISSDQLSSSKACLAENTEFFSRLLQRVKKSRGEHPPCLSLCRCSRQREFSWDGRINSCWCVIACVPTSVWEVIFAVL